MIWQLLTSSVWMVVLALATTIVFYVVLVILLRKANKYNTRNFFFIFLSVFFLPTMFVELSVVYSTLYIKHSIVPQAEAMAFQAAAVIDELPSAASAASQGVVEGTAAYAASELTSSVISASSNRGILVGAAAKVVSGFAETAISAIGAEAGQAVAEVVDGWLPDNPIQAVKERFPVLARFLDEHGVNGRDAREIVLLTFQKLRMMLTIFALNRLKNLGIFFLCLLSVSLLAGWRKKVKNAPYDNLVAQQ